MIRGYHQNQCILYLAHNDARERERERERDSQSKYFKGDYSSVVNTYMYMYIYIQYMYIHI